MTLKDIILKYRKDLNLSQREFAAKCDLSNVLISNIEKDKVNPNTGKKISTSIDTLIKIASGMGISLNDLFMQLGDDIPIGISSTYHGGKLHPSVVDMLNNRHKPDSEEEEFESYMPKTNVVKIISAGANRMPEEDQKRLLDIIRLTFHEYENYFKEDKEGENNDDA